MTQDDVLFGYRLQVFDLAGRTSVSEACRTFGIHRSTYYAWKQQVERGGLEMLRPRERRRPRMPNQLPAMVEERVVAFAIAHPGLGPKKVAAELARPKWGGIVVSPNGVYKTLLRHGLNTAEKRLSLVAGYRAPYEPNQDPGPERHIEVERPGELVGMDCFYVGRLRGTRGTIWQLTAIDLCSSFGWAELVICPTDNPTAKQTSKLAGASPSSSARRAGSSSASSATTATSSRASPSATRSPSWEPARPTSTPAARRPTATSRRSTRRSSRSAGGQRSRATSTRATPACAANSTPTSTTTTSTASTTAG